MEEQNTLVRFWNRNKKYILSFVLIVAILISTILLYKFVRDTVIDSSIQSIEELTLHDKAAISKSVEYRWKNLEGIGMECRQSKCQTIGELLELLHMKEISMDCIDLALVAEDGDICFGSLFITQDEQISGICADGGDRFVERYDGSGQNAETKRECLMFGVKLSPFTVEGKTFSHIVCRYHISTLANELKIDSYNGAGYSSVFDMNGNYIVQMDRSRGTQERDNFYSDMEGCQFVDGMTVAKIRERIDRREVFTVSLEKGRNKKLMRFTPMEDMDWYFVMSVEQSVFERQSMDILRIALAFFVIMMSMVAIALGMFLRGRTAVRMAKAEQDYREELSKALALAEQANKAKTAFLNNMSHDIRTPMNAVIGFTTLAAAHIDEKERVSDYLDKITQSSNHLLSLINDVLDMSRIESGRVVIEEKPENLAAIIYGIRDIIQTDIRSRQLELHLDAVNVTDEDILCDKLRLNQVLLNLLSNAMKFTPAGGTVSLRLMQKESEKPGYGMYEIRVRDTGIGMSPEFVQTIFEPFTRERTSTVSGIQGTGLGMSITKNIVDMMGGQIRVESRQGEGTEFFVTMQFRLQSGQGKAEPVEGFAGSRVLVADGDAEVGKSVCRMLQEAGMQAEWTASGHEAVKRAGEAARAGSRYELCLIDRQTEDMDGIEAVGKLREIADHASSVILLSSYDWTEVEQEAKRAGVTGFLNKPLFRSELYRSLSRISGERQEEASQEEKKTISFKGRRILLVEDNELNQEIATAILEDVGFLIETASNGQEAVEAVQNSAPGYYDLVLMDVQMPVMNGHEASRAIRRLENPELANILIIAMTANAFEEDKQAAMDAGMNAHVGKPIDIPVLLETLKKYLL